ncbi:HMA2 domain-containing protein [Marichromatium sp. AB32]|uniref:HMA2 domain-containing protein n=1 Tax=Marichromatium sp. AB32 TaxID=2483363 RepID=UPI0011CD5CC5|nr:hypothetical protein [Marichromatium sp. AB32]
MPSVPAARQGQPPPVSICHQVPGRVRLRVPLLLAEPAAAAALVKALRALPGVEGVRSNPACASLVVRHHASQPLAASTILSTLTPLIHQSRPPAAAPLVHPIRKTPKWNRAHPQRVQRRRSRTDCPLCRLKLRAARWIMADVWRCWQERTRARIRTLMVTALSPLRH